MTLSAETLKYASNAACAIGILPIPLKEWRKDPLENPLEVYGSGFLVRHNTVITNQHVLEALVLGARKRYVPDSQLFVSFTAPSRAPNPIGTLRMIRRTLIPDLGEVDVALLEIKPDPPEHFEDIPPLRVAGSSSVLISEEVFLCGYPYTNLLLQPEGRPRRNGPVIQQGYVSGLAPYAGADAPEEILLDVRTAEGMSGSPVIRSSTGELIGIHYEAVSGTKAITTTTFAIPVDEAKVSRWLAEFDEMLDDA
jgi:S1-C subfamily serine protease